MTNGLVWYEDPEFWDWTNEFLFTPQRWESAADSIGDLVALLEIEPSTDILDLCCGPGRFSIPLAGRGLKVTAVDRSPQVLDELRRRSRDQGVTLEVIEDDMRTFARPMSFDVVLNLFTSFGYFDDPADNRQVLQNVYDSLRPGGRFLLDVVSRDWAIANFQKRDWTERKGRYLLEEREFIEDTARARSRWIIVDKGEEKEFYFDLRLYAAPELITLLRDVEFAELKVMSSFKGEPFDLDSPRLIILAHK